jgi:hypothetical protein
MSQESVDKLHDQTDSGAGNQEPDPATAENPPSDIEAGDAKRGQAGAGPDRPATKGEGVN